MVWDILKAPAAIASISDVPPHAASLYILKDGEGESGLWELRPEAVTDIDRLKTNAQTSEDKHKQDLGALRSEGELLARKLDARTVDDALRSALAAVLNPALLTGAVMIIREDNPSLAVRDDGSIATDDGKTLQDIANDWLASSEANPFKTKPPEERTAKSSSRYGDELRALLQRR